MSRQPAIFVSHGGGPCFWIPLPGPFAAGVENLQRYLAGLLDRLPARPSAILVITGHWETPVATVSAAAAPPMLYDYYGFPEDTYRLSYPAPGDPELARRIRRLLTEAGLDSREDRERGFDHGVFVPMLIVDPDAAIPVVMMSIEQNFDPARHIAIGRALAPLRDENVLIIGSGNSFHNLRAFGAPRMGGAFDAWLADAATDPDPAARAARLADWLDAPEARLAQPREDHLVPLFIVAGAAGDDPGRLDFHGELFGHPASGFAYG